MKRTVTNLFILFCAALGVVVSLILTYKHYRPETDIGCGFEKSGCAGILNSAYGSFGPIPTALVGLGMYAAFIALALRRGKALSRLRTAESQQARAYAYSGAEAASGAEPGETFAPAAPTLSDTAAAPRSAVKQTDALIWGLALCAFGVSWWLQYTALFVLQGFCPWCFTSAILVTLIFLVSSWDFLIDGRELTGEHKMLGGVSAFICVLLAFMYGPTIIDQYQMNKGNKIPQPSPVSEKSLTRGLVFPPDTHVKGDPNAPLTIVEFADYECPTCGRAVEMLDKALAAHPKGLQIGFRNMPLAIADHKWNKDAAAAAEAAALQGKFWEMHDLIFKRQDQQKADSNFQPSQYDDWAKELGLNADKFRADRESEAIKKRVQKDAKDGGETGLQGTPTYFLIRGNDIQRVGSSKQMKAMLENPKDALWQTK